MTLIAVAGIALAAGLLAFVLPIRTLAFCWAMLLPIYGMSHIGSTAFDVARVLGVAVIALRCRGNSHHLAARWAIPIAVLGVLITVDGFSTGDQHGTGGLIMMLSVSLAYIISQRPALFRQVLTGFATGCCASSIVLLMELFGHPTIALAVPSIGRFSGLSSTAPRASTELALAVIILYVWGRTALSGRARIAVNLGAILCTCALFACGGRTGLAGIALALIVAIRQGLIRLKQACGVVAASALILYLAGRYAIPLSSVQRTFEDQSGAAGPYDVTTGRGTIFEDSLHEFLRHPLLGAGYNKYVELHGIMPHFAPLNWAVTCGVAGAAIGAYLLVGLASACWTVVGDITDPLQAVRPPIFAVMIGMTVLEPDGPFVGLGLLTLLLIVSTTNRGEKSPRVPPMTSGSPLSPGIPQVNRP